jgi:hypothetical protein
MAQSELLVPEGPVAFDFDDAEFFGMGMDGGATEEEEACAGISRRA